MLVLLAGGCEPPPPAGDPSKPVAGSYSSVEQSLVDEGRATYERYCVGCHGTAGDGAGDARRFLHPPPRDFVAANFKFSSTRSGQLPTDDDLRRMIRNGLRGSAMPGFGLLPDRTIDALIAYIKTFSPRWKEQEGEPTPIPFVEDPYRLEPDKTAAIQRGEVVYHGYANCWACHPAYVPQPRLNEYLVQFGNPPRDEFRPDLYQAVGKENEEGEIVYPPDFRRDYVRAGVRVEDLYRSIAAGISGSAMPTWVDSIDLPGPTPDSPPLVSKADLWAMSYYVQWLLSQRPPLLKEGQFVVRDRPRPIYLYGAPPKAVKPEAPPDEQTQKAVEETFTP
ncbi:MAG: cytochrome c [Phycisphaerae bacterium]|nr:cytochrome c [Phycisphaerae bacterium]